MVPQSIDAQTYLPKFDVQGHRGARGLKPENTIPAFLTALDYGVTTLELDVVITKDKKVVVSHEPWMFSGICLTPNGNTISEKDEKRYNIYELTYEEVKKFDCGSIGNARFPEQEKIKISKPLLSDVIVAAETHIKSYTRYEVDYNIEIKSEKELYGKFQPYPEEFSDLVFNLIDQYLPLDRVVIQSFDFKVLQYFHEKYPQVRLAALVENEKSAEANLKELGFIPSIYSPYFRLLDNNTVKELKTKVVSSDEKKPRNMRVIPWTVNEEKDMLALKGMGVDGFITDYPNRAAKYKLTLKIEPR
ncbi:MAG: glycerophosphodiester phosphodiesterase family protein [Bacteroidota bacterium]|nr:glycerophosphodiester phosphodiesterase [Flammeovirgaceae bacterium]MCZ8070991.1 glycerophosphodiester phosphodiesterase family protein [Cytophagales bacterium]